LPGRPVTVTLTTSFIGTARRGTWLEGRATIRRAGRRPAFGACDFHHQNRLVFTATAVFAVTIR